MAKNNMTGSYSHNRYSKPLRIATKVLGFLASNGSLSIRNRQPSDAISTA